MAPAIIVKNIRDIGDYEYERVLYEVTTEDGRKFKVKPENTWPHKAKTEDTANGADICLKGYADTSLNDLAEIAEGCFMKESNFFKEIAKNFKCTETIRVEYNGTSVAVNQEFSSAYTTIRNFKRKQKLLDRGIYYLIGSQSRINGIMRIWETWLVLASNEESAIRKVLKNAKPYAFLIYIGKYNKNTNTFLLKNASEYSYFYHPDKIDVKKIED